LHERKVREEKKQRKIAKEGRKLYWLAEKKWKEKGEENIIRLGEVFRIDKLLFISI
jgi:hypothetical protein